MRDVDRKSSLFDRFAESASEFASHAVFFIACLLLVVVWVPSYYEKIVAKANRVLARTKKKARESRE